MVPQQFILHVDMDAFYVSVELLRRPELVGRPVVVGASGSRGVVAAASYEARQFGVHSAMSASRARTLCPEAVFLPADIQHYIEVGEQIVEVLTQYTPLVEPISVDESFLDVTGSEKLFGSAENIAWSIRKNIADSFGLSCSVGVAPNKFLAKLASEHAKPRASAQGIDPGHQVFVVEQGRELEFLHPLPVSSLWGVGPATWSKLDRLGVRTVGQLAEFDESLLRHSLGDSLGSHLFALSHAIDDRRVEPERVAKSIGNEETFSRDLSTFEELRPQVVRLCDLVARRVRQSGVVAGTISLKIKFSSFTTITRSVTLATPIATAQAMFAALWPLLLEIDPSQGVRLVGVHASKLQSDADQSEQQSLFDDVDSELPEHAEKQWSEASLAMDSIVEKFGRSAIRPASSLGEREPGLSPYGPDEAEEMS